MYGSDLIDDATQRGLGACARLMGQREQAGGAGVGLGFVSTQKWCINI